MATADELVSVGQQSGRAEGDGGGSSSRRRMATSARLRWGSVELCMQTHNEVAQNCRKKRAQPPTWCGKIPR